MDDFEPRRRSSRWKVAGWLCLLAIAGICWGYQFTRNSESESDWPEPDAAVFRDRNVEVTVSSVQIDRPLFKSTFDELFGRGWTKIAEEIVLVVKLRVRNRGAEEPIQYQAWSQTDSVGIKLVDDQGRLYKRLVSHLDHPEGMMRSARIMPANFIEDVVLFEDPKADAQYLRLQMAMSNVGSVRFFRVQIPSKMFRP